MLLETLPYLDDNFKIIIHESTRIFDTRTVWAHWHESIELVYVVEGNVVVTRNGLESIYIPGDLIIFNSNEIHSIHYQDKTATFHSIIADLSICNLGSLPQHSVNSDAVALFLHIIDEFREKKINYKEAIIGGIKLLQSLLTREKIDYNTNQISSRKQDLVKQAISYMYIHFREDILIEDISTALHYNKYYLCHVFKEVTGRTILTHLNYIRCDYARSLLVSGKYSVTEVAYLSGFSNSPHFTQTYKNIFNRTPISFKNTTHKKKLH